jgi:quercetin dioxygenase-like cupin family protein
MPFPSRRDSLAPQRTGFGIFSILVAFLLGTWFGKATTVSWSAESSIEETKTTRQDVSVASFVKQLSDVPVQNTAHMDPQGRPITKQQLLEPFVVPRVAGFSVATIHKGQTVSLHNHDTMHEFFYVLDGSAIFTIVDNKNGASRDYPVRPGSFSYFAALDKHAIHVPEDSPDGDLKVMLVGVIVE